MNEHATTTLKQTQSLIPDGKEVLDVVADYLRCLREYTLEHLKSTYGEALDTMSIEYVLTVPAVRKNVAKYNLPTVS
jgi:hypothetical protein